MCYGTYLEIYVYVIDSSTWHMERSDLKYTKNKILMNSMRLDILRNTTFAEQKLYLLIHADATDGATVWDTAM